MDSQPASAATHWLDGLRGDESLAAQELWNHYFARLVRVAEERLKFCRQEADGEDIALSALKSVMIGVRENRYPGLTDTDSLWPLLVTITARKSIDQTRRQMAGKRSVGVTEAYDELIGVVGREPSAEFAAEVADELDRLINRFNDERLRQIAELKLSGAANEEIAEQLGLSTRTVIRKINLIRQEWEEGDETLYE